MDERESIPSPKAAQGTNANAGGQPIDKKWDPHTAGGLLGVPSPIGREPTKTTPMYDRNIGSTVRNYYIEAYDNAHFDTLTIAQRESKTKLTIEAWLDLDQTIDKLREETRTHATRLKDEIRHHSETKEALRHAIKQGSIVDRVLSAMVARIDQLLNSGPRVNTATVALLDSILQAGAQAKAAVSIGETLDSMKADNQRYYEQLQREEDMRNTTAAAKEPLRVQFDPAAELERGLAHLERSLESHQKTIAGLNAERDRLHRRVQVLEADRAYLEDHCIEIKRKGEATLAAVIDQHARLALFEDGETSAASTAMVDRFGLDGGTAATRNTFKLAFHAGAAWQRRYNAWQQQNLSNLKKTLGL